MKQTKITGFLFFFFLIMVLIIYFNVFFIWLSRSKKEKKTLSNIKLMLNVTKKKLINFIVWERLKMKRLKLKQRKNGSLLKKNYVSTFLPNVILGFCRIFLVWQLNNLI